MIMVGTVITLARRRMRPAVAALVLGTLAFPAVAGAEYTTTQQVVIQQHRMQSTSSPGNCVVISVVPFPKLPLDATKAVATYTILARSGPRTESASASGPGFNDRWNKSSHGIVFSAPGDTHWVQVGQSSVSGPLPNDCSQVEADVKAALKPEATLVLTYPGEPPACGTAKAARKKADEAVAAARKALSKAKGKAATRRAAKRLAAAKRRAAKAREAEQKACRAT